MTLVLAAVTTVLCEDMALVPQVKQRPIIMVATQDDAAALATVTAVRTSIGVVLDMLEVHGASAALS